MVDYDFRDNGTIVLVCPMNDAAREHLEEQTGEELFRGALPVEHRYAPDLSAQLCRDGFTVELPNGRVVTAGDLR